MHASIAVPASTLSTFEIDADRGYLPTNDPLQSLPPQFEAWEVVARQLPKLLITDCTRDTIEKLPPFPTPGLVGRAEIELAMQILSYLGHAYVWAAPTPAGVLPANLSTAWFEVAQKLGRPPVLSYASYALHNWRRIDPAGPIACGNIVLLQNFMGGIDEEWFILIHVDIEAKAARVLRALVDAQQAVAGSDSGSLQASLETAAAGIESMHGVLSRMTEYCDPYIYYNRVRPYIHGWKDNPALPHGVVYSGVAAYGGKPQMFRGETGSQSGIIPACDAALGIAHQDDPLRRYLMEMRDYMPPAHRKFVEALEQGPRVREAVKAEGSAPLKSAYNACVHWVQEFRSKHLDFAASYIQNQKQTSDANPTAVGTGGTPFMVYLQKHRDESRKHLL